MNVKIINDSGNLKQHSNSATNRNILLEYKKQKYQIQLHIESYSFQSYGRLNILNKENSWEILKSVNPCKEYAGNYYSFDFAFTKIIKDFKKLIIDLDIE